MVLLTLHISSYDICAESLTWKYFTFIVNVINDLIQSSINFQFVDNKSFSARIQIGRDGQEHIFGITPYDWDLRTFLRMKGHCRFCHFY